MERKGEGRGEEERRREGRGGEEGERRGGKRREGRGGKDKTRRDKGSGLVLSVRKGLGRGDLCANKQKGRIAQVGTTGQKMQEGATEAKRHKSPKLGQ